MKAVEQNPIETGTQCFGEAYKFVFASEGPNVCVCASKNPEFVNNYVFAKLGPMEPLKAALGALHAPMGPKFWGNEVYALYYGPLAIWDPKLGPLEV